MAILELPTLTDGTPAYTFRTQLEGVDYEFDMRYGERRGGWVFDLRTSDGIDVLLGQLVTIGRDLLGRVASDDRPPGVLWALNVTTPTDAEGGAFALPGLIDLGADGRCRMYYTESTTGAENEADGIENPFEDL